MANTRKPVALARRRTTVTLYQGDYEPRLAALAAAVDRTRLAGQMSARFATAGNAMRLAHEYDELRAEAEETAVKITLEALPRSAWAKMLEQHPPRESDERDGQLGANQETIHDELVSACVVDPVFTETEWVEFADDLSAPAWQALAAAAWTLNVRGVDLPKSSLVSQLRRSSDDDSK